MNQSAVSKTMDYGIEEIIEQNQANLRKCDVYEIAVTQCVGLRDVLTTAIHAIEDLTAGTDGEPSLKKKLHLR